MAYIFLNFLGLKQSFKINKKARIWVNFENLSKLLSEHVRKESRNRILFNHQFARIHRSSLFNTEKNSNRPITKFYDSDDVNVIAVELWLAKTRPTFFIRKIIFYKKLWKLNFKNRSVCFWPYCIFLFRMLSNSLIFLKTASWNYRSLYFCSIY